jgi:hypothetical protein
MESDLESEGSGSMKIMVGYNGSDSARRALELACTQAKTSTNVLVYVITSMEGGST